MSASTPDEQRRITVANSSGGYVGHFSRGVIADLALGTVYAVLCYELYHGAVRVYPFDDLPPEGEWARGVGTY
jgi:hypothetical protein